MTADSALPAAPTPANPFAGRTRHWWVGLTVFLLLLCIGVAAEFGGMNFGVPHPARETAARYQMMLECFSLLLIYVVPFFVFARYTRLKVGVPRWLVVLAFASGWLVPGWIAGELNAGAADLLAMAFPKAFLKTWGDAIEAPVVEETLKVLTVVFVLGLVGRGGLRTRKGRDWLVAGMCVGMGFQVSEDLGYIEEQVAGSHADFVAAVPFTLDSRVSGGLVSHWTYTALMAVAVWLFFCERQRLRGFLVFLVPMLSHFAWDSPLSDWGALPTGLICALTAVPFLYVWSDIAFDDGRGLLAPRVPRRQKRGPGKAMAAEGESSATPSDEKDAYEKDASAS